MSELEEERLNMSKKLLSKSTSKHDSLVLGITSQIAKMKPHERLTPERQMAEVWGVSRMTLRRALEVLQDKGLIYTVPSSGMFVAEPRFVHTADVTSLSEVTRHRGAHPNSKIHLADRIQAEAEVSEALGLKLGSPVYRIEQTFYDDNTPLATETSYVPVDMARGLIEHDLTRSLSSILAENFERPILRVKYRVRSIIPEKKFLERLSLESNSPVFEFCARGITHEEKVAFYVVSFKRGDKYDLTYEIEIN